MSLPTVILPGYLAGAAPYQEMERSLKDLGIRATTVPLTRWSWLPTLGGRSIGPILQPLQDAIEQVLEQSGAEQVNLVGHSAGGWIARIYLGDQPYDVHARDRQRQVIWQGRSRVARLITLGTPHLSQERWTRRNLDFVNQTYPGAFYPEVDYVCVAGKSVYGQRNWKGWFTYNSYLLTSGCGDCWGDGITPVEAAHLEAAKNVTLEGVYHSPQAGVNWYGTPEIVKVWAAYLG